MERPLDEDLLRAWAATRIVLERDEPIVLAGPDAVDDWPFEGEVAVVTAANPLARRLDDDENARRTAELAATLADHGHPAEPVTAGADDWHEPSLAVPGLPDVAARHLCRQYDQLAFFVLDATSVRVIDSGSGDVVLEQPRLTPPAG